jgi:hypothetical protein
MYHRRQTGSPVQPDKVRVTSSTGDVVVAQVTEWLSPGVRQRVRRIDEKSRGALGPRGSSRSDLRDFRPRPPLGETGRDRSLWKWANVVAEVVVGTTTPALGKAVSTAFRSAGRPLHGCVRSVAGGSGVSPAL